MNELDIHRIMQYLPHRYPFLMVDRVLECEPGKRLRAIKNVSINEPYFTGHFPQRPVMPGVLILEALAQATGILAMISSQHQPDSKSLYFLVGVDNARFKQVVEPGDQLLLEVSVTREKRGIWVFAGEARVDGKIAASAELMCTAREQGA
jgi:3-hydroxyacyl-[acyl-carrier-protein] dehydratase